MSDWRNDFFQPVGPIVYFLHVGRMTQVGVCSEENARLAGLLGFINPNVLELLLGQFSERQWDQLIILTVSPEDGSGSCRRPEKLPKTCQTSITKVIPSMHTLLILSLIGNKPLRTARPAS